MSPCAIPREPYAPDADDSQKHAATANEIWKALEPVNAAALAAAGDLRETQ
jgi:hypothetical protein